MKLTAAPIELKPVAAGQVKQGEKVEFTVNLDRKYGFADPVTIGVALPKGTKGLTIGKLTIAKDQKTGKFTITATDKATVGDLALNVEATMKLQKQTIRESGIPERINRNSLDAMVGPGPLGDAIVLFPRRPLPPSPGGIG